MKKNTKIIKIIISVLIFITLFTFLSQTSLALNYDISNKFENKIDKSDTTNKVAEIIGKVINAFQIIATGIAILMLVILGIQWIYAAPFKKAQLSKSIRYYVLGAIIIFAAVGLLQIVKMFVGTNIVEQV